MKKYFAVIMGILLLSAMLFGCKDESLTDAMQKALGTETLTELGRAEIEDALLLFASTQEGTCYAAAFLKNEKGNYIFEKELSLTKCNGNNFMCKWGSGYAFLCNDSKAAALKAVITPTGGEPVITDMQIDGCPWVYYLELPAGVDTYSGTYFFLDAQGGFVA